MLLAFFSPKRGSGVSVVATAAALGLAAATEGVRLADLGGDAPALLGLAAEPDAGLRDWLAVGPGAPPEALDRLAVDAGAGLTLLGIGSAPDPRTPEAAAALATVLSDDERITVADLGAVESEVQRALAELADVRVVVARGCYLTLRRGVREPLVAGSRGVVHVAEDGRAIGARDVADVLGVPLLATVPVRCAIARAVDAGLLAARPPDQLVRPVGRLLRALDVPGGRDRAA
jgi:hypothetical protein